MQITFSGRNIEELDIESVWCNYFYNMLVCVRGGTRFAFACETFGSKQQYFIASFQSHYIFHLVRFKIIQQSNLYVHLFT